MGQVALGLRSLLFKLAVFFVMAALLAWALGGTLWPRATRIDQPAVSFAGQDWFWEMRAGGTKGNHYEWLMMNRPDGSDDAVPVDARRWLDIAGPLIVDSTLYYAGRPIDGEDESWWIEVVPADLTRSGFTVPDRLAVDRQFARLSTGLPLQDLETIRNQRDAVLDPIKPDVEDAAIGSDIEE